MNKKKLGSMSVFILLLLVITVGGTYAKFSEVKVGIVTCTFPEVSDGDFEVLSGHYTKSLKETSRLPQHFQGNQLINTGGRMLELLVQTKKDRGSCLSKSFVLPSFVNFTTKGLASNKFIRRHSSWLMLSAIEYGLARKGVEIKIVNREADAGTALPPTDNEMLSIKKPFKCLGGTSL